MNRISSYSIYTEPQRPAPKPTKPRRPWLNRKVLTWTGLAVLVIALGASAAWGYRRYNQQKLLASIKENPREAFQAVRDGKISREDAREVMEQAFEERMNKEMDGYFALTTEKDRNAYLDKLIDERQAQMREWRQRATTQPSFRDRPTTRPTTRPSERDRGGDQIARMRSRIQTGNPARAAQRAAFMSAMQQRMAARGIQPGRGGPGGWGGGPGGWGGGRGGRGGGGGR